MKIIDFQTILDQKIQPRKCIEWVDYILKHKYECNLPPKISLDMDNNIFMNTMPSYIPMLSRYGVKIVSRYPERVPSLWSDILLYDSNDGNCLALMDGTWITAMRTGAVASLAIKTFQKHNAEIYAFMGLGNTARATVLCLAEIFKDRDLNIRLLAYKGQEKLFIERFSAYKKLHFEICPSIETLITDSDVVVSCVTAANHVFAPDYCFKEGVLVVPVHTRGFQNCDLFFDKVYADDTAHVKEFRYFSKFKKFEEFSRVLLGQNKGRENDQERILAYNIGISLHDIYFASQIYDLLESSVGDIDMEKKTRKFWV